MAVRIHPTAVVDSSAQIDEDVSIGPFAVVEGGVSIRSGCTIFSHVVVKRGTSLGRDNRIHEAAILGGAPQDLKFADTPSSLRIGDENIIREGVTMHRSARSEGETVVGSRNYLMVYAHVAHDCFVGDDVIVANNVCLAGHVTLESRSFISGGVVIHQFSRIGRHSMVAGNAKVEKDVLPYFLVDGVPARSRGLNLVGLKRAGFSRDEIRLLKDCYRLLTGPGKLSQHLKELENRRSPLADEIVAFIRSSNRGFCRAVRSISSEPTA